MREVVLAAEPEVAAGEVEMDLRVGVAPVVPRGWAWGAAEGRFWAEKVATGCRMAAMEWRARGLG